MINFNEQQDWISTLLNIQGTQPKVAGYTGDEIAGRFDSSYDKAIGKYDPFPGSTSKIDQLQGVYEGVDEAYDVSDTLAALGATRKTNLLTGEQAANNAARKFSESSIPGGSSGVGSAMIRAQALLPFLKEDTEAAVGERKYADSAKQEALKTASGIAATLAQLQQDYTNSLASYNSGKANFGINYAGQQSELALGASQANAGQQLKAWEVAAQLAESRRLQASRPSIAQPVVAASRPIVRGPAPSGTYMTNNAGQVVEGNDFYNRLMEYRRNS